MPACLFGLSEVCYGGHGWSVYETVRLNGVFACPPLNGVAETLPTPFVAKDVSRSTAYQEEGLESIQRTVLLSRAEA